MRMQRGELEDTVTLFCLANFKSNENMTQNMCHKLLTNFLDNGTQLLTIHYRDYRLYKSTTSFGKVKDPLNFHHFIRIKSGS